MKAKIDLHTHDANVSFDSTTPPELMARVYDRMDYDAVGFVGHDNLSEFDTDRFTVFNGIERTVSESPEIHIVDYPEIGFRFLAHPARIMAGDAKETAIRIIRDRNLNGVEKFNEGTEQYDGDINTIELANDDAHNLFQIGTSWMLLEVPEINRGQMVQAIKRGDFELKNKRRRIVGSAIKGVNATVGRALSQ